MERALLPSPMLPLPATINMTFTTTDRKATTPELTVSGSVKAGYYANYAWKLPILVSGALSEDSVIRVGVREGIKPNAGGSLLIAEPAGGVTLRAENFKADAADCVTSLGDDGKVYLVPCTHEMDDTGYTCKKCKTQFDARVGDSAYYQTLTEAFDAARGSTVTLLRDVTLTGNCSSSYTYPATLDLNGKTVSSGRYPISVGGGNKSHDSDGQGFRRRAAERRRSMSSFRLGPTERWRSTTPTPARFRAWSCRPAARWNALATNR